jgi:Zn-dependent peptidase ImmA (M78 family)
MARPRKVIDIEQLRKCAEKQWHIVEIAAFFRVSVDTIRRRYADIIEESKQAGKAKLRDLQWKRALEGSDTMIKHMSEHYLEQHTRQRIDLDKVPEEQIQEYLKKKLEADE